MAPDTDPGAIEILNHDAKLQCVAFKPNSYCIVGADALGNLCQWMGDTGEAVGPCAMKAKGRVYAVVASMDGRWIVSADLTTPKVIIWSAVTHKIVIAVSGHENYVYAVDVSSDSRRVASGSEDRTAQIFDILTGVRVIPPLQHDAAVVGIKFSPDGRRIATATHLYTFIGVYDANSGDKLSNVPIQVAWVPATPLAWSYNGQRLFIASPGRITCFDPSTSFRFEWPIQNCKKNVFVVTYGRFIACSSGSLLSFWDYASRKQIASVVDHATTVSCISISHDGRYLACGHDGGITVHDLSNFLPSTYLQAPRVSQLPLMQLSDAALESWALGGSPDTERILSEEIEYHLDPSHYAFAARSLTRAHSGEWQTAMEDADRSLQIKQSPIGQIARSLALIGVGRREVALEDVDLVFRDCDQGDNLFLLVIKSIFVFICGKHEQAVIRLRSLVSYADEEARGHYLQVLGNMYLKQRDYENAVQTLEVAEKPSTPQDSNRLLTISLIFNWNFNGLKAIAWRRLCEALYAPGRVKEIGDALLRMVGSLAEDEKESAHGHVLKEVVTRSGGVTLLEWTGKSSACNSCLPSSPAVYSQDRFVAPHLERNELERRTNELRAVFPLVDALVIYGRLTRMQPPRFVRWQLLLPCIVLDVTGLEKEQANVYRAKTAGLGDVEFTTTDSLPLKTPWRLVFADTRIHGFDNPRGAANDWEDGPASNTKLSPVSGNNLTDTDAELVNAPIITEAPSIPSDIYTRALELIAHLEQPFSTLLLLRQSDDTYRRVAADHEIVVGGIQNDIARDIRVEVLQVL